jgi:hypothetical protein
MLLNVTVSDMPMNRILVAVAAILSAPLAYAQDAPLADNHQHLFSPALAALISPAPPATRSRRSQPTT